MRNVITQGYSTATLVSLLVAGVLRDIEVEKNYNQLISKILAFKCHKGILDSKKLRMIKSFRLWYARYYKEYCKGRPKMRAIL